jgi:hypothetical protein
MDRREFIATAGTVAAVASTSQAFAQMAAEEPDMHPPQYKALEKATVECVATGNDCLRHWDHSPGCGIRPSRCRSRHHHAAAMRTVRRGRKRRCDCFDVTGIS